MVTTTIAIRYDPLQPHLFAQVLLEMLRNPRCSNNLGDKVDSGRECNSHMARGCREETFKFGYHLGQPIKIDGKKRKNPNQYR